MIALRTLDGLVRATSTMVSPSGYPIVGRGPDVETALYELGQELRRYAEDLSQRAVELRAEAASTDSYRLQQFADVPTPVRVDGRMITDARGCMICVVPEGADAKRESDEGATAKLIACALDAYLKGVTP